MDKKWLSRDKGSYRDPAGHIYHCDNRIFRTITTKGIDDYRALKGAFLDQLVEERWIVNTSEVSTGEFEVNEEFVYLLEHEKLPFISYPYEWSFNQLKSAAIFHLSFHLKLLDNGFTLKDASAYNIQFSNRKPIFIDFLSIKKYRVGEFWEGQKQFTEQFLIPLLLSAEFGIAHNSWYRGNLEGISATDFVALLPWFSKYTLKRYLYITLPEKMQQKNIGASENQLKQKISNKSLSLAGYKGILKQLRNWIKNLEYKQTRATNWGTYSISNTYSENENKLKREFIVDQVRIAGSQTVADLGCNTGEFSRAAFEGGAKRVVGFDFDTIAINNAYIQFQGSSNDFLPLFMDATNPSPNLGWNNTERLALSARLKVDFVIALAFIHHLAIARNIFLDEAVQWIVSIAPHGIIEFVEKSDTTVQIMLSMRDDLFHNYTRENFETALSRCTTLFQQESITKSGRILYRYFRDPPKNSPGN